MHPARSLLHSRVSRELGWCETVMLGTIVLLAFSALARGSGASCQQPIRPVFSAPLLTSRHAGARTVNHTHGQYLLLAGAPAETDEALLRPAIDSASSWSGEDTDLVAETFASEDWIVTVYCQKAPDVVLGSIKLQARLDAAPQQPWEAVTALEDGALVATDDTSFYIFGWNDIVPCLPQLICSTFRSAHYYEKETHISKFIALVAVGTIALTSVTFICLTILRQPCWSESLYDDHYWESSIDLEKLDSSHHLRANARAATSSVDQGTEASVQAIARLQDPRFAQEAAQAVATATLPAPAVGLESSTVTDGAVWRTRAALRLGTPDGSSSDDSDESFDSARDVQMIIHSRMV